MGNFKRNNRGFDRRNREDDGFRKNNRFGEDRGFDRPRRRSNDMFEVTCAKCGKPSKVPFRPTGNKPVYCSDCFRKNNDSRTNFDDRNSNASSQSKMSSDQFNQLNYKLDKILKVLQDLEIVADNEDSEDDLEDDSDDYEEDLEDNPEENFSKDNSRE